MSERKMNPPIPGHELKREGEILRSTRGDAVGGCRCGLVPDGWETMGVNAVKRWHRQHKAELRTPIVAHTEGEWPSRKKAT